MAYTKYSLTPANNTAAPPDGAPEGMLPSAVNDTMRDMMAQIRDVGDGIRGGTYTMTAPVITGGSITGVALSGNTLTNPVITGGSINNTTVGATTASTGAFTTLGASGVATFSAGTVSAPAITTTGDTNTGIFFPAADTIAFTEGGVESMRIDSSGNVGIGTSSPSSFGKLAVAGNILTIVDNSFIGLNDGGGQTSLALVKKSGLFPCIASASSAPIVFSQSSASSIVSASAETYTERMRIDSSGNVGIGTSSPAFRLDLVGTSGLNVAKFQQSGSFQPAYMTSTTNLSGVMSETNNQNGLLMNSASNFTTLWAGGAERMRIDSSGNLLVGATSSFGGGGVVSNTNFVVGDSGSHWKVTNFSATYYFNYNGSDKGTINGSTGVYTALSDENKKKDFESSTLGLDAVMALKPTLFRMIDQEDNTSKHLGFIAQDVKDVIPQAYTEQDAPDGKFIGLQDRPIIAVLTKAIQELKATVDAQAARIAALESK